LELSSYQIATQVVLSKSGQSLIKLVEAAEAAWSRFSAVAANSRDPTATTPSSRAASEFIMKRMLACCLLSAVVGGVVATWLTNPFATWPGDQPAQAQVQFPGSAPARPRGDSRLASAAAQSPLATAQLTPEELTNIRVYESTNRGVVNINTKFETSDRFFLFSAPGQGSGSGSVIDRAGHVLTNYHVVEDADQIQVTLGGGEIYAATMVGYDAENDIAVLKIDAPADQLIPIRFGSSDQLKVGQRVYALGNPFGLEGTITTGIISNLNRTLPSRVRDRELQSIIQTDAALNPGNSGGPLLDTSGRMIGMNVAIASKSGQNAGLGFAIPINRIARYVPELIENGRITRPDLGIIRIKETDRGLQIVQMNAGGPAEAAGLRGYRRVQRQVRRGPMVVNSTGWDTANADYILEVDGQPVKSANLLIEKIETHRPGESITLTILRDGKPQRVAVTLGAN
jgi:S1-C subfamily serine protease